MPRWGFLGVGDISTRMAADMQTLEKESISAVCGRRAERVDKFASTHGIPFPTTDRRAFFARSDVDIVYVATPVQTHFDLAMEALEAGKHVLVEKPMTTSSAQTAALFEAASAHGKFLMEAMWMRFNPLHAEVIERVHSGELGPVRSLRAAFGTPFHPRGDKTRPEDAGSILLDRGIYPVTLAHWFLGEPQSIEAAGVVSEGVDLAGHATLEYEGGRFAQLAWSGLEFLDLSASVSGGKGWLSLDPMFWAGSDASIHAGSADRIFRTPERLHHPRVGNGYGPMLEAVADAVQCEHLQHPLHNAPATTAVARTLERISAQIVESD